VGLGRVIVVHDRGIEAKNDDRWFTPLESPEKKLKK
jgi:hypothetical protein